MLRIVLGGALAVLAGPVTVLGVVVVAALTATDAQAACPTANLTVARVPAVLDAIAADGSHVHLGAAQLARAATVVTVGARTPGVGTDGVQIALMAALTESGLRNDANPTAYPASTNFPHDGVGSDHDSLGMFQMRPAAGWGTVAELMDPTYQARAFFGGPTGPNHGSPRGLLDVTGWASLPKGAAAQAVEVSAYPDRYARFEPVAAAILAALTHAPADTGTPEVPARPVSATAATEASTPSATTTPATGAGAGTASSGRVVFPLPDGTWTRTSGFGMRLDPVAHVRRLHAGVDLAAAPGTPVLATADGRVVAAGPAGGLGNRIVLDHVVDGREVASVYGHLRDGGIHVTVGQDVLAGQRIGDVGSTGDSTGPHLHVEIHPGGPGAPAVDPQPWLDAATHLDAAQTLDAVPSPCPAPGGTS